MSAVAKRNGKALNLILAAELRDALDAYLNESEPSLSLTSAVSQAIKEYLKKFGYWPPRKKKTQPEEE